MGLLFIMRLEKAMPNGLLPTLAISLQFFLLMCSSPTPTNRDHDNVCEIVFKHISKSGIFRANTIFISMSGDTDPSINFIKRFDTFESAVYKGSLAVHSSELERQVIHRTTKQPGVLLKICTFEWLGSTRARVEVSYDMHLAGSGSCTYTLTKKEGTWEISEKQCLQT